MARVKLDENATIADVLATLSKPEDYVRGIVGSFVNYQREYGAAVVRIGTTGRGKQPNYRLEPKAALVGFSKPTEFMDAVERMAAFNGVSHKQVWDSAEIRGEHWSRAYLDLEETQAILGDIRNFKRR